MAKTLGRTEVGAGAMLRCEHCRKEMSSLEAVCYCFYNAREQLRYIPFCEYSCMCNWLDEQ